MKKQPTINVLGTEYTILTATGEENPKMKDAAGLCEAYAKKIYIDTSHASYEEVVENFEGFCQRVLRHEAFHAIFHEAGLSKYYEDETLVEALAILYPRIEKIMNKIAEIDTENL